LIPVPASTEIVPVVVTGPPINPRPVFTWVTVPVPLNVSHDGTPAITLKTIPADPTGSRAKAPAPEA
jgi:hypothetical protein